MNQPVMDFRYQPGKELGGIDSNGAEKEGVRGKIVSVSGIQTRPDHVVLDLVCFGDRSEGLERSHGLNRNSRVTFTPQQREDDDFILEGRVPCEKNGSFAPHMQAKEWYITLSNGRLWLM